jgi:hypothetical protein
VHPPGSEDFEATAIAWLLDVVPPDFRLHGVLRRHPVALAVMARHHTQACVEGARAGYRTARTELGETLPPHAIDAVLAAYRTEGRRLASTAKAVVLIEEALRGDAFTPQLRNDRNRNQNHKPLTPATAGTRHGPGQLAEKTDISMIATGIRETLLEGGQHDSPDSSPRHYRHLLPRSADARAHRLVYQGAAAGPWRPRAADRSGHPVLAGR